MIAVDTNLLVYAHREDNAFHERALSVLTKLAVRETRWAIPWPCVHEFLAIVTHPRIYRPPTPMPIAINAIRVWLSTQGCRMIGEGIGYFDTLSGISIKGAVCGAMVHDARIAAICLHNGVRELWSADRDFSRFPSLKTRNPM